MNAATSIVAVALALFLAGAGAAQTQSGPGGHDRGQQPESAAPPAATGGMPHMGMAHANHQKLADLARTMNEATGQKKFDAMAALLNALVEEHQAMPAMMSRKCGMMQGDGHDHGATP